MAMLRERSIGNARSREAHLSLATVLTRQTLGHLLREPQPLEPSINVPH
jgi:hypothetical protein